MFAKIGPGANTIWRRPVVASSWMMSVPVMSDGIRSGVNWMRLNFRSTTRASVWMSSVLARPGTPTIRLLPPAKSDSSTCWTDVVLADDQLAQLGHDLITAVLHPVGERDIVGSIQVHDFLRDTIHSVLTFRIRFQLPAASFRYLTEPSSAAAPTSASPRAGSPRGHAL